MKFNTFEEIIAWQKAQELALDIYKICSKTKDYSFADQIRRASISISNNIAEGYERKTNNEFKQFLFIAKGSSAEVRSMLYLAKELKYMSGKEFDSFHFKTMEISKLLSGLIKTL